MQSAARAGTLPLVLLAVDIGNTNIVFGVFDEERLLHTFRAAASRERTADEFGVLLRELLALRGVERGSLSAAIVASVVPPLTDVISRAVRQACARDPVIVGPGVKTGMPVLYENPKEVGADRIVNAVAAYHRFGTSVIVVDFGTATTFDCVSSKGEYQGGVIVPGIQVSLDGLLQHAAKLSRIEIAEPPRVLGRNTAHALQSGIVHGYASLVDGLVDKLRVELGEATCIATGGLAPLITKHTARVSEVDLDLTLHGLRLIHEKNKR
jgi:type III pantothenate kinase